MSDHPTPAHPSSDEGTGRPDTAKAAREILDRHAIRVVSTVEYGRQFEDGEVIPSPSGYVSDPRWLTCAQKPVRWVQRTVTVHCSPWSQLDPATPTPSTPTPQAGGEWEDALRDALLNQPLGWQYDDEGKPWPPHEPHANHRYNGGCAICRLGDRGEAMDVLIATITRLVAPPAVPEPGR